MRARRLSARSIISLLPLFSSSVYADESVTENNQTEENVIVVTAELKETNVLELPASVSVIDESLIEQNNGQHFSDLLNLAPNVNFATGASRGKFVQIRGIGERSEFSAPVNYSVGIVVDGIDLTGIASAATLLDTRQVEILRGPQGTLYGANGLAGLINIVSNSPTDSYYAKLSATVEEFSGRELSAIVSGPASEKLGYRLAVKNYQSDGFMQNIFLGRDDTNNLDESTLKGKLVYQANKDLLISTSLLLADIDNGYDAFSLDSNRNTYSDNPGHDRQETQAFSVKTDWQIDESMKLEALFSLANSDLEYGYDEDWSHPGICDGTACDSEEWGFDWWYESFDNYSRANDNRTVDIRLHSDSQHQSLNWVLGFYHREQTMDLVRKYTFLESDFSSQFDTTNYAVYGQLSKSISEQLSITAGLRFENRDADYLDSDGARFNPDEDLWGGKLSLEYRYAKGKMLYGLISRGYKAGGFNASSAIPVEDREYETEFMWNYETGIKGNWLENNLTMQASIFYQQRDDIQSKQSLVLSLDSGNPFSQQDPCPCSFNDYIKNANGGGISYGFELETLWRGLDNMEIYSSLGLLRSEFEDFLSFTHVLADQESIPPVPYNLDGRAVAHAPEYQLVVGANYFINERWTMNAQVEAKDDFYFSDRHQEKTSAYEMLNLALNYYGDHWQVKLFARNLLDKDIQTRGFGSFGNDPRKLYQVEPYYQFAAPRVIGISASIEFE